MRTAYVGYVVHGTSVRGTYSVLTCNENDECTVILNANPVSVWAKRYVNDVYIAHLINSADCAHDINTKLVSSREADGAMGDILFNAVARAKTLFANNAARLAKKEAQRERARNIRKR
ncbi:hypothetical protein SARC_09800 [Sphaeroforma arctica JP610]|uniref:Uncharacterized protein n=1 Tax=Sphaeroforma arctica JP610 TaxID=667725 RepID=A0A0L0FML4_9EUKA|nr:hypothetical protein SARC_09800 [Sphaeroforma arctica JP610]KNC77746.1 hypothetical protein SARC_09800 [Sphaeroforma arctica JP610]|eukprot:XP_014151648.1 hypothetical protein SARC_09800 [Sphaeroforma arctica JP610]